MGDNIQNPLPPPDEAPPETSRDGTAIEPEPESSPELNDASPDARPGLTEPDLEALPETPMLPDPAKAGPADARPDEATHGAVPADPEAASPAAAAAGVTPAEPGGSSPAAAAAGVAPADAATVPGAPVVRLPLTQAQQVKLALSLGAVLAELRGRILEAEQLGPSSVVQQPSDGFWLASNWRGLFARAAALHLELLGDEQIDLARFNLSADRPSYLNGRFRYTEIGLRSSPLKFDVAEKLRQTINFLTCLYLPLDDYTHVLEQVFKGEAPPLNLPDGVPEHPSPNQLNLLIHELSTHADALITAWDSYVREQLFSDSERIVSRYAYDAARAMSELTWTLTIEMAPYRTGEGDDLYKDRLPRLQRSRAVYKIWVEQFKPQRVIYLQRQLSTLSKVLEDDYQTTKLEARRAQGLAAEPIDPTGFDPRSPRAAINAVIQSIDYWQDTILEMSDSGSLQPADGEPSARATATPSWNQPQLLQLHDKWDYVHLKDLRLALLEQSGNWFNLVLGQQDLSSFRLSSISSDLLDEFGDQIAAMARSNLQDTFKEVQQEMKDLAKMATEAAGGMAAVGKEAILQVFTSSRHFFAIAALGAALVVILGVVLLVVGNESQGPSGYASLGSGIISLLGVLGIRGGTWKARNEGEKQLDQAAAQETSKFQAVSSNSQTRLGKGASVSALLVSGAKEVREYLENVYSKGFAQMQRELGLISSTIAVSEPLVDFVTRNCDAKNDLDFLSKVVWDDETRRSQLNRIIVAAFGPIGAFMTSAPAPLPTGPEPAAPRG